MGSHYRQRPEYFREYNKINSSSSVTESQQNLGIWVKILESFQVGKAELLLSPTFYVFKVLLKFYICVLSCPSRGICQKKGRSNNWETKKMKNNIWQDKTLKLSFKGFVPKISEHLLLNLFFVISISHQGIRYSCYFHIFFF